MKKFLRYFAWLACVLAIAAGLLVALLASFALVVLSIVRLHDGKLLSPDSAVLSRASVWLMISVVVVGIASCLRPFILADQPGIRSFKLQKSSERDEKLARRVVGVGALAVVVPLLLAAVAGNTSIKLLKTCGWLGLGFFGAHFRLLWHELAHLAAARALGFEAKTIQVGIGPLLWSRGIANSLRCEWRSSPLGVFVMARPRTTKAIRLRLTLFTGAGPLSDAIVLCSVFSLITLSYGSLVQASTGGAGGLIASALFSWAAFSAIAGVIPHSFRMGGRTFWTDGYWLLRVWTASRVQLLPFSYPVYSWREALDMLEQGRLPQLGTKGSVHGTREKAESAMHVATFEQRRAALGE